MTATPTPSPTPVPATATPRPTWVWPTPTAYPTMDPANPMAIDGVDFTAAVRDGGENVVGIWNTANTSNSIDVLQGILIFMVVLRLSRQILREWRGL